MNEQLPPSVEHHAALELRSMEKRQGNYTPHLDTADVAVCRAVARHIHRLEARIRLMEQRLTGDHPE